MENPLESTPKKRRIATENDSLIEVIRANDIPRLKLVLVDGFDVHQTLLDPQTGLDISFVDLVCASGNLQLFKICVDYFQKADANENYNLLLEGCIRQRRANFVKYLLTKWALLEEGRDIDEGHIRLACRLGETRIIRLLPIDLISLGRYLVECCKGPKEDDKRCADCASYFMNRGAYVDATEVSEWLSVLSVFRMVNNQKYIKKLTNFEIFSGPSVAIERL
jgi:hypothetical protein